MILVNAMKAKPGENNLLLLAGRVGPGHWEVWKNYIHFLVTMHSQRGPSKLLSLTTGRRTPKDIRCGRVNELWMRQSGN